MNHDTQKQFLIARFGYPPRTCGTGATAEAHPVPAARGDRACQWSVRGSGNWRVVFRFEDGEAVDVDLIDYH